MLRARGEAAECLSLRSSPKARPPAPLGFFFFFLSLALHGRLPSDEDLSESRAGGGVPSRTRFLLSQPRQPQSRPAWPIPNTDRSFVPESGYEFKIASFISQDLVSKKPDQWEQESAIERILQLPVVKLRGAQ
ncbi:hypothetical protein B0H13DRAFT_1854358 [Mycena leptocephala]|nr:hypothetical protein B0H13DRAFT_1854358 [Mycena leptocephala]